MAMSACCGGSKVKNDKYSTFSDACYTGNLEKMKECLKAESKGQKGNYEAVINKRDANTENHFAPIHRVCETGHCPALKWLIEMNADTRLLSKNGETPLHVTCFHRHYESTKLLLQTASKADVNVKEKVNGMTPLHVAVWRGCPEIVELLIQHGADPTIKDKNGHDCVDHAEFWSKQEHEGMASPHSHHIQTYSVLMKAR